MDSRPVVHNDAPGPVSVHTYFNNEKNLNTFKDKRLDWILVSNVFKLETYDVSQHTLSDHSAFVATISLDPSKLDSQ